MAKQATNIDDQQALPDAAGSASIVDKIDHDSTPDDVEQELENILGSIKHDPSLMGILSLGKDGVMRSLTADRRVVDAVGLRPNLIVAFLGRLPPEIRQTYGVNKDADGTKVPKEQWFSPDISLLPEPMSDEVMCRVGNDVKGLGSIESMRKQAEARGMKFT